MVSANPSKPILITVSSGIIGSPVYFINRTTGESICVDDKDIVLRINKSYKVQFDAAWFENGWTVGDIIEARVVGKVHGSTTITLTADTQTPQSSTFTAASSALSAAEI